MDSSLHMHVASLRIQDDIRRASSVRHAQQAKQASRAATGERQGRWVAFHRVPRSLRRAY